MELTAIEKTPNPGILRALFSVSLQNELRLCENDPLFDRKLLDYLHEQVARSTSDNARTLVVSCTKRYTILSPKQAPIGIFLIPFSGFKEMVSTAKKITVLKGYFSKITHLIAI